MTEIERLEKEIENLEDTIDDLNDQNSNLESEIFYLENDNEDNDKLSELLENFRLFDRDEIRLDEQMKIEFLRENWDNIKLSDLEKMGI